MTPATFTRVPENPAWGAQTKDFKCLTVLGVGVFPHKSPPFPMKLMGWLGPPADLWSPSCKLSGKRTSPCRPHCYPESSPALYPSHLRKAFTTSWLHTCASMLSETRDRLAFPAKPRVQDCPLALKQQRLLHLHSRSFHTGNAYRLSPQDPAYISAYLFPRGITSKSPLSNRAQPRHPTKGRVVLMPDSGTKDKTGKYGRCASGPPTKPGKRPLGEIFPCYILPTELWSSTGNL